MTCQKCKSERVAHVGAKCSDMFSISIGAAEHQGYVLDKLGIGSGDYVGFKYCLDCGQLQGQFPLPKHSIEESNS